MPLTPPPTTRDLPATRFTPPRTAPTAIERQALIDRIEGSAAPLTLLCAPAGFGKTTLMQQLRQRQLARGVAAVWLRVDAADNDLGHFLRSLLGAIASGLPRFLPPALASAARGAGGTVQGLAAALLEQISMSEAEVALYLDDLEPIIDAPTLAFLQRLLTNLGPRHRVFIGARGAPRLALGRLRAHGLVLELDQTDLRFSAAETRAYLERQSLGAPGVVQSLQQRTEGWPVALQLAAITLNAQGDRGADWLQRFSGSTGNVDEYLAQEVLDSRPADQRDFLLRSSVLGELRADLCDAVLGRSDSAGMIAEIERGNGLLAPADADQHWHRYHPLFGDFLRERMRQAHGAEVRELHLRAARWSAQHGLAMRAAAHALAAPDHALAAEVLAAAAMDMVHSGRVGEVARAIAQLPQAEVEQRPALLRAAAFAAVFARRDEAARHYIDCLERAAGDTPDDELIAMRLMLHGWSDRIPEVFDTVAANRARASQFSPFNAGLLFNASAFCHMALGRPVEAQRDLAAARQACEPIHALYVLNYSASFSAAIEMIGGDIGSARATLETAMARSVDAGQKYGSAGAVVATYLAELLYETDELDACETLVVDYLPIVVETGLPDHLIVLHRTAARLHGLRGRPRAAQEVIAELGELGQRRGLDRLVAAAWLERVHVALRGADRDAAGRALALGADPVLAQRLGAVQPYAGEVEDALIAQLRVQLVFGPTDPALPRVQAARQDAEATGRRRRAVRLRFLESQILERLGRQREASAAFEAALTWAARGGLVRTLADDAWAVDTLCRRAAGSTDPAIAALVERLRSVGGADAGLSDASANPAAEAARPRPFHLTTRELQILRLLWKGHSNKALARDLFLSENTIETHLRRIYEKLGTRNRTQAAALAREAGAI